MSNDQFPIRLIKFSVTFLGPKATATINNNHMTISKDGVVLYDFRSNDIKKQFRGNTGVKGFSLVLKDGKKLKLLGVGPDKDKFIDAMRGFLQNSPKGFVL